jgi:hypothetical protein
LAAHLELSYEDLHRQGTPEHEAFKQALADVPDWAALSQAIRRAERLEDGMKGKNLFWLLILFPLTAYLFFFFPRPEEWTFVRRIGSLYLGLSPFQLGALVGLGVLLSCWCKRVGGGRRDQLAAVMLFPSFLFGLTLWGAITTRVAFADAGGPGLWEIVSLLFVETAIPVAPLLLGLFLVNRFWGQPLWFTFRRDKSTSADHMKREAPVQVAPQASGLAFPWLMVAVALPIFVWSNSLHDRWLHGRSVFAGTWPTRFFTIEVSFPQLGALLLLGWVLAHASRRMGGGRRGQILTSLFPAGWWLGIYAPILIRSGGASLAFRRRIPEILLSDIAIPAAFMFIGALIAMGRDASRFQPSPQPRARLPSEPSVSQETHSARGHVRNWLRRLGPSRV